MSEHVHGGCCGCSHHEMGRRTFLAAVGGTALSTTALTGCATTGATHPAGSHKPRVRLSLEKKELSVQPVLSYEIATRRPATSWRPWGGLHTESDVDQEAARIGRELDALGRRAEFAIEFRPVAKMRSKDEAGKLAQCDADVLLVYAATGGGEELETLITPNKDNLMFLRHRSGPVYLWYEIANPRFLRKTVDEYKSPGLERADVVVDNYDEVLWRLRALYALKNTRGTRIVAIGDASGWGAGGQEAPKLAREKWRLEIQPVSYDDLGKRIAAARDDAARVKRAEADAKNYLEDHGVSLRTDKGFVSRAFLLTDIFRDLMAEADAQAITVNNCMSTIMPMSETTACLPLSLINDSGALAFCESDFVVIPSGILLHHIAGTPVFLNDPTYPHEGVVTCAHCTAPRRMDGKHLEKATILTHFESDYGAAPKVDMRLGQIVTVIDPDFGAKRYIGFRGKVVDNPFLDICRSQVDISIEGDWRRLVDDMCGFHWMVAYGDHLEETGYALRKLGIDWLDLSNGRLG